jgi:cobalt-zinc-cadmium resistance protein CzcA
MATAFGEVYQHTLDGSGSLMDTKTFQDWTLRYALRSVPGVSEVNAWGGQSKQYAIQLDSMSLRRYGLTVHNVVQRVAGNNANFGGAYIEHAEEQYTVRGLGRASNAVDLENTVVRSHHGAPVLLRDLGNRQARTASSVRSDAERELGVSLRHGDRAQGREWPRGNPAD